MKLKYSTKHITVLQNTNYHSTQNKRLTKFIMNNIAKVAKISIDVIDFRAWKRLQNLLRLLRKPTSILIHLDICGETSFVALHAY